MKPSTEIIEEQIRDWLLVSTNPLPSKRGQVIDIIWTADQIDTSSRLKQEAIKVIDSMHDSTEDDVIIPDPSFLMKITWFKDAEDMLWFPIPDNVKKALMNLPINWYVVWWGWENNYYIWWLNTEYIIKLLLDGKFIEEAKWIKNNVEKTCFWFHIDNYLFIKPTSDAKESVLCELSEKEKELLK